jgi:3-hydroxyisobutyrate dehydrogenase
VRLVDDPAATGRLRIFAGGADADLDRVEPVLVALGTVRRCGPLGSGAAVKLVLNTAMITAVAALADAFAVAAEAGLTRADAVAVLRAGPLGAAAERALAPPEGVHFTNALAAKDLDLALAAVAGGLPVVEGARRALALAVPNADLSVLAREAQA